MSNAKKTLLVVIVMLLLLTVLSAFTITYDDEYKLIRRFGKIDRVESESGIAFKIPYIEHADIIPRNIQIYDIAPSDVITMDKKTMVTDIYVLWKIVDPMKFAKNLNCSTTNAEARINTAVYNSMKSVIGRMSQADVIMARDGQLSKEIMSGIGSSIEQYGIELVSVETKRLDLPSDNKQAVYERMISERNQIAATYTAQGESESQIIKNETDKNVAIMLAEAKQEAEKIIAEGEATYMQTLADAYNDADKAEFYSFVRSLDAAKAALKGSGKTLILDKNSPLAQIFTGK